jgi:Bardet-Biedl syndrome 5 protein
MTNVRLVWHANLANNFNVSLPYMQIKCLRIRDSKFGFALVVETFARSGGYILGFRIDPKEKLDEAYKEILSLHQVYGATPIFGVEHSVEAEAPTVAQLLQPRVEEDVEITEEENPDAHAVAAYYVEGSAGADAEGGSHTDITFDSKLGLAVETLQSGVSLESLWRVV